MDFRSFKKVAKAIKIKASSRGNHERISSRAHRSTHGRSFKRIMVFGDSNAFRPNGGDMCWPSLLENKDPHHLNVFNESCDGRTTRYDIGEKDGLSMIANKLKIHSPLAYVIVMLGTNELKSKYGPPSASDIADGMRQILDCIDLHGGGAKPILLTPPPMGNVISGELVGAQSRVPLVASEYRLLAMNLHIQLIDLYAILDTTTDLESDMTHFNAIGRQKVANAVWASLNNMTPRPPG